MTEIQKNIAVANFVIDELHKDKPFVLKLDIEQRKHFLLVLGRSKIDLKINHNANGCDILIEESIVHPLYAVMANYIAKHDLPESVVESLKEVS